MSVIHVLDPHLTNMIAAGEVVDRPANIVKECAENALDAGASSIFIDVEEGGISRIVITDDGCGMDRADARMAFARHSTSKLSSEDDLFRIQTMGFRGEALASIASVAKVDLTTNNGQEATHVRMEYGEEVKNEPTSCPRGTRIEVTGLFVQTPARLKYLKKANYEFSVIADAVNKLALAHPEIRFSLTHDGRMIFQTFGKGNQKEILYQMMGREVAENAVEFLEENEDFTIQGLAVQPKVSRANKRFIYTTINGRTVRCRAALNAVLEGYSEFMPKDRYPIVLLNIEVDPQLVDVNVHPNKMEVRLSKEDFLSSLIINTIERLFYQQMSVPSLELEQPVGSVQESLELSYRPKEYPTPQTQNSSGSSFTGKPLEASEKDDFTGLEGDPHFTSYKADNQKASREFMESHDVPTGSLKKEMREQYQGGLPTLPSWIRNSQESTVDRQKEPDGSALPQNPKQGVTLTGQMSFETENRTASKTQTQPSAETQQPAGYPIPVRKQEERGAGLFDHLRVIGQFRESYILCESPDGLLVIDQHAAQERANFEKLEKIFNQPVTSVQPLMVPLRLEVSSDLFTQVDELNQETDYYGLHFEPFGQNSLILRQEPGWLNMVDKEKFLNDLLAEFARDNKNHVNELRRKAIATMACHSSIRFNRALSFAEMEKVIVDLQHSKQPFHCPHGRPVAILLDEKMLRKEFERG